ncbi:MAG TPA: hypothetical protein VJ836_03615 [Candidatus Saccharimonadales bacterium]|nr:hypothetical protein [Candidatus Saccharimonadales bacterium]
MRGQFTEHDLAAMLQDDAFAERLSYLTDQQTAGYQGAFAVHWEDNGNGTWYTDVEVEHDPIDRCPVVYEMPPDRRSGDSVPVSWDATALSIHSHTNQTEVPRLTDLAHYETVWNRSPHVVMGVTTILRATNTGLLSLYRPVSGEDYHPQYMQSLLDDASEPDILRTLKRGGVNRVPLAFQEGRLVMDGLQSLSVLYYKS